jgi:hypothetical protein
LNEQRSVGDAGGVNAGEHLAAEFVIGATASPYAGLKCKRVSQKKQKRGLVES